MRAAAGPLVLLGAIVSGVALGEWSGAGAAVPALVSGVLLAFGALALGGRARLAVAAVALALLGTASMQRALHGLERSPLDGAIATRRASSWSVTLVDDPVGPRFVVRVLARAHGTSRTVLCVARGDVAARLRLLDAGDSVSVVGALSPLSGRDSRYRWRHAVGVLDLSELRSFTPTSSPVMRVANALRAVVVRGAASLAPDERALLTGFLLGDTRGLSADSVAAFRGAGLTHLLAVSGENVAFVLVLAGPLLRRLRLRLRFGAGLAVLGLFGTMTRWEPSVLRAVAMAACVMLASYLGRPAAGLRVLALAVGTLLLADPFLVHSVGFLMSCGATAGIAVLARPIAARLPGPALLRAPFAVTLAAQLGVAPVVIPTFGSMPVAALPANLAVAPLVGPVTVWGLASGAVGGLVRHVSPGVAAALQLPTGALLRAIEAIATTGAVPFTVDGRGLVGALACGCAVAALGRARRARADRLGGVARPRAR